MQPTIAFIGKIHSALKRLEDCPRQGNENAPDASVEIFPEFVSAVHGLQPGATVHLFTWLHLADRSVLTTKPRNDASAPDTGVFATRSPDRPNPIGMHTVKVLEVHGNRLKVSGLEALDQTPLVDVKPVWGDVVK